MGNNLFGSTSETRDYQKETTKNRSILVISIQYYCSCGELGYIGEKIIQNLPALVTQEAKKFEKDPYEYVNHRFAFRGDKITHIKKAVLYNYEQKPQHLNIKKIQPHGNTEKIFSDYGFVKEPHKLPGVYHTQTYSSRSILVAQVAYYVPAGDFYTTQNLVKRDFPKNIKNISDELYSNMQGFGEKYFKNPDYELMHVDSVQIYHYGQEPIIF